MRLMSDPKEKPFLVLLLSVFMASLSGCNLNAMRGNTGAAPLVKFSSEYQAVFLDNGIVYFGKLENPEGIYPLLRNVFYVRNQPDNNTKEIVNLLVKRGNEWHRPDVMYINQRHIVMIEPVAVDSQVGKLIKEANEKTGR